MKRNILILICFFHFVSLSQDTINNSIFLNQIVLTGQYIPTHIDSSIYSVDIITKEDLESFGSQNLSSVFSRQIGVDIFHDPFLGNYIDFQGISGENIKVLIDGVEMSGMQNGSVDFSQINLSNIEKVEIIEGPLSAIYGNNALGATINLISKIDQNEKLNTSMQSYVSSIGQYNLHTNIGYEIGENILFTSIGRNYFDGWSDDDDFFEFQENYYADSTRFNAWNRKYQWFLKSNYIYKTQNNLMIKPYVDFMYEEIINKGFPQGYFSHYAFDEYYLNQRLDKGVIIQGPFVNRNIDVLFHHNRYNRIKNKYYTDLTNLSQFLTEDVDSTILDLFSHRVTCSNLENQKVDYQYGYTINYRKLNTNRILNGEQKRTDFSAFSSLDFNFKKLFIRTSFRYLYSDENDNAFTPSLNLKLNSGSTYFRCSYAYGFRTPSLKEMYFNFVDINHNIQGNPNLQSEYSKNFQINVNSNLNNQHNLNAKFFYNNINNFITLIQNENSASFDYINIGNYKNLGVKFGATFNLINTDVNFNLSYLGNNSIYNQDLNFHTTFNALVKYRLNSKNKISVFYSFKGEKMMFFKNNYGEILEQNLSSYSLLDISYDMSLFNSLLDFSFGINNVLNIQNIDSETLISSFHNNQSDGVPLSCGRYIYTSLKMNLKYD